MTDKRLLFVLGLNPNWGLYAPGLLELARREGLSIHVLETGAPLGTGNFTSNAVMNENDIVPAEPAEPLPEGLKDFGDPYPSEETVATKTPQKDETNLAWPDTVIANAEMKQFIGELIEYFQSAGIKATGDWQPDLDGGEIPEYARRIGAEIVALPRVGFPSNLLQNALVSSLTAAGLRVEVLEEISEQELAALEARTTPEEREALRRPTRSLDAAMRGELPLESVIGQRAKVQILARDGSVIVNADEAVTREALERARREGLESDLLAAVETQSSNTGAPINERSGEVEQRMEQSETPKA